MTEDQDNSTQELMIFPFLGKIFLFVRALQRTAWGFFAIYLDYKVFSGAWRYEEPSHLGLILLSINLLVLLVLFGERALRNLIPFWIQFLAAQKTNR